MLYAAFAALGVSLAVLIFLSLLFTAGPTLKCLVEEVTQKSAENESSRPLRSTEPCIYGR